jgi:SAM-dependent methyltransferase/uncharacterized protein YbaR (Trm112 family)
MNHLSPELFVSLVCPSCKTPFRHDKGNLCCKNNMCHLCGRAFQFINGVPVLIDPEQSVFAPDHIAKGQDAVFGKSTSIMSLITRILPSLSLNISGARNIARMRELLFTDHLTPRVLIVGGGELGVGMRLIADDGQIQKAEMDVYLGSRTNIVGDAHDIPFMDGTFNGVIIQAVLQHVLDPWRVVTEIHRVLNPGGFVYAETAFIQSARMGRYDFTRFTHLGHRRLFRWFDEIDSGVVCGPGMAAAHILRSYALSFSSSKLWRGFATILSHLLLFPLKYTDSRLSNNPAGIDTASGTYFLGRSASKPISDQELIKHYRGLLSKP